MPPLYRMPIVYVLGLIVAALVLGLRSGSGEPSRQPSSQARPESARKVPPGVVTNGPPSPSPLAPPSDGILRTPEGLRRKVLIKDLDVVCRREPTSGVFSGSPLDYFAIRYVYGAFPVESPTAFQIGAEGKNDPCWVPATAVLEWDTRLMAQPTPASGRPPIAIFREASCLLDLLAHRKCPRHAGQCPTEGEERSPGRSQGEDGGSGQGRSPTRLRTLGMPILASRAIPQPDGSTRTIFQVASLVRDEAPPPAPPAAPPRDLLPLLRRVEVAFVIDTTASMQATIAAAQTVARQLVANASDRHHDVTLRLALVDYRDDSQEFGHITRIVTRFTTPQGFLAALETLRAARRGDGTIDEAVFDGIAQALPAEEGEAPTRPGLPHLDWSTGRAGEFATKMIVLLGDAPDHARDLARAEALAARARRAGITIATVALNRPGVLSRDEQARYQSQWQALAAGSFLPRDKAQGFRKAVAPLALRDIDANRLVPMLQAVIDDRIEHARSVAALAIADAEGRLGEYVNSQGLTLDQVAPVLVDLHRGDASAKARPDPRFQGKKAPSVRTGWLAQQSDGHPLVTVETLMSRAELDALIEDLTQLQQAAQGTARDLAELAEIGTAAAAGEASFLAVDRGSQTFADHLRRRQGLPPARSDSLLQRTQADLLQADETTRTALDQRLAATLRTLIQRRNSTAWNDPRQTVDGMTLIPYDLIDF